jgi:hypothetical protein
MGLTNTPLLAGCFCPKKVAFEVLIWTMCHVLTAMILQHLL